MNQFRQLLEDRLPDETLQSLRLFEKIKPSTMNITIIVACDQKRIIGQKGKLPWRMPEDLQIFKKRTMGHAVIMGRKTWESLPKKPLEGRANVVISRTKWQPPDHPEYGPHYFGDIKTAIDEISKWAIYKDKDIYIIGGSQIYESALNNGLVDRIIMSKIKGDYEGDVSFPILPEQTWKTIASEMKDKFDILYITNKNKKVNYGTDTAAW